MRSEWKRLTKDAMGWCIQHYSEKPESNEGMHRAIQSTLMSRMRNAHRVLIERLRHHQKARSLAASIVKRMLE